MTPAEELRAAAERARQIGDPLHTALAPLLERHAKEHDASVVAAARVWPNSSAAAAAWLAAQVSPQALAVARQVLGTTSETTAADEEREPIQLRWGLDDVMYGDDDTTTVLLSGPGGEPYWVELDPERTAALRAALAGPESVAPPTPADRAATRDRIRRAICEASGFTWLPDELMEPDEYGEHADAVLAVLDAPADRAAILREAADRFDAFDLRVEAGAFRRMADEAQQPTDTVARRRLTPAEHDRAWHAIEGSAGGEGADPGTVLNAVLHALRIDAPTPAEEQAASPSHRLAGEAQPVQHAPRKAVLCPDCRDKGRAVCLANEEQPAPAVTEEAGAELLTEAERQFLAYALHLADEQMATRGDEFIDDDRKALVKLQRLAKAGCTCCNINEEWAETPHSADCPEAPAVTEEPTPARLVLCPRGVLQQRHASHWWSPQPGMSDVRCPGLATTPTPADDRCPGFCIPCMTDESHHPAP